jgi:hypothetical protein
MSLLAFVLGLFLLDGQLSPVGKVESRFDKTADFQSLRTYSWGRGNDAFNPAVHKLIVAAIEEEMKRAGFSKVESGGDVTIAYSALNTSEVDLEALDKLEKAGTRDEVPTRAIGKLGIIMRRPAAEAPLWSAATREVLDPDLTKAPATVQAAARRLFESYPGRRQAKD